MPRKPNYDFERKERDRLKKEKKAARANEKVKPAQAGTSEGDGAPGAQTPGTADDGSER